MWGNGCCSFEFCRMLLKGWPSKTKIHPAKTRLSSSFPSLLSFGLLGTGREDSSLSVSLLCLLNSLFKNLINLFNSLSLVSTVNTAQGLYSNDV